MIRANRNGRIFLPKWTRVLIAVYNEPPNKCYSEKLHRLTGMTTRHLRNLIADLEAMDVIEVERTSKIKYLSLTQKGVELAESLLRIYPALRQRKHRRGEQNDDQY